MTWIIYSVFGCWHTTWYSIWYVRAYHMIMWYTFWPYGTLFLTMWDPFFFLNNLPFIIFKGQKWLKPWHKKPTKFVYGMWSYSTSLEPSYATRIVLLGIQIMVYGPTYHTFIWISLTTIWVMFVTGTIVNAEIQCDCFGNYCMHKRLDCQEIATQFEIKLAICQTQNLITFSFHMLIWSCIHLETISLLLNN